MNKYKNNLQKLEFDHINLKRFYYIAFHKQKIFSSIQKTFFPFVKIFLTYDLKSP